MPGGRRKAAPIFAPEIGTLSPSVITKSTRPARGRREIAAADDALERLEPRRGRDERALRRRPIDPDRTPQRRDEDILVDAREEMRQDAIGEGGDPDRHVLEGVAEAKRGAVGAHVPDRRARALRAPASNVRCQARRWPPHPSAPCAPTSIRRAAAQRRAPGADPQRASAATGRRRASAAGSGSPMTLRTTPPRRRTRTSATSGNTTARARSAPSGVSSESSSDDD